MTSADTPTPGPPELDWKLWIYTNYDCNLRCAYCLAHSSPQAPRRAIGLANVQRLVDEAVELAFGEVFFTGGEPLILDEIYAMLAYAAPRLRTTLLTNAMLLRGKRMERLVAVAHPNLTVQVSLDGACAEDHDAYRGAGSWEKTLVGIRALLEHGFHVRLSTTETPANTTRLAEICALHQSLGIPEQDHFVRPMAHRGFADTGVEVSMLNLNPEITVNVDGVFWHPLSTDPDMQVSKSIFPLADAIERVRSQLELIARTGTAPRMTFT
jgi:MoaA/NifB/PqqE/SkfB family radical SAM enzyme